MSGLRQIVFSQGDEFISPQGIIYDASTDTYVRLRRADTLRFDGTQRKLSAHFSGVTIAWLPAQFPNLRQQITDWWFNRKETSA